MKTGLVNVLAKSLKNAYKFHFVSKVAGRMFLKINFSIDTTLPTFQRQINIGATLKITVQTMLIRRWEWSKIRNRILNVAQQWYNVGVSIETILNQRWKTSMQPFFNVAQCLFNVVSTLIWHYFNVILTWSQCSLNVYKNQSCKWNIWICRNWWVLFQ